MYSVSSVVAVVGAQALAPQAPASVEGVVVVSGTLQVVSGVRVQLSPDLQRGPLGPGAQTGTGSPPLDPDNPQWYSATTAQDGRFAFENVKPGRYRLIALRSGYLPAEFGQRSPTAPGAPFALDAGQRVRDIQISITPTGSIAGRVFDREGPVGRVQVQALRPRYRDGRRALLIVQSVLSDDRGEYRLFWLPPGPYYVTARPVNEEGALSPVVIQEPSRGGGFEEARPPIISTRTLPGGEIVEETHLPVYFPGTTSLDGAARIDLKAGANAEGLDISLVGGPVRTRHIRGVVISAVNGQPSADASVLVVPRTADPAVVIPSARSRADGTFDISGVVPGSYFLFANNRENSGGFAIEVGDGDVDSVTVTISPGFRVAGRFSIEGRPRDGSEPDLSLLRVTLERQPNVVGMPPGGASFSPPPAADGSFVLQGVPVGDFQASIRALPPDAYVKSMRLGTADVLDSGLHLSGTPRETLEIVIVMNAGQVAGTVMSSRNEPLGNAVVVVVPDGDRHRADLYKRATSDGSGRFSVRGVAAGTYRVFAWEVVEEGAWQDPDFIRASENRGTAVRVRDGADENVQVTVIEAR